MTKQKKSVGQILTDWAMPILLVLLMIFFFAMSDKFLTVNNITNILIQNVHVAVTCVAVFIIMISGGCDLSIGYQVSVAAVLCAKMLNAGAPVWVAMIFAIVLCSVLGAFNGAMALLLNSNTMIVTLATMAIFRGISYLISNSKTFYNFPNAYVYLGQGRLFGWLPVNVIIMIVIIAIAIFVMSKTSVGRKVYAAGDNPEAARLAGLNVARIKILAFTVAGAIVGVAAILLTARSASARSDYGVGIEFTGINACVLSGVALKGGEGTLWKAIVAVYVLGVLSNGMSIMKLEQYPQYIATGIIMLLALYLGNRKSRKA